MGLSTIYNIISRNNSVSFRAGDKVILYEQLSNSIHCGDSDKLDDLAHIIDSVSYTPIYEGNSLKKNNKAAFESLLLNVTEDCNIGCIYCVFSGNYVGERLHSKNKMSFDTARKAIDMFVPFSKTKDILIGFYGGEPLTNALLIRDVVQYAKTQFPEKTFVFSVTTNFVNTSNMLEFFVEYGLFANISLDGPQNVHDKYRVTKNGQPTYAKIMKNIKALDNLNPGYVPTHIGLNATCNDSNDFPLIVDYLISRDADFSNMRVGLVEQKGLKQQRNLSTFTKLVDYADVYTNALLSGIVPPKVLQRFYDEAVRTIYTRSLKQVPESLMLSGACYPGNRKIFVDTAGDLYMCEKFGGRQTIGSIDSGLNKETIEKSIDNFTSIRNSYCSSTECWAKRLCTPCIHSAKDPYGEISIHGLSQKCQSLKLNLILGINIYRTILEKDPSILSKYFDNQLEAAT